MWCPSFSFIGGAAKKKKPKRGCEKYFCIGGSHTEHLWRCNSTVALKSKFSMKKSQKCEFGHAK
jgi:hypothetical protein